MSVTVANLITRLKAIVGPDALIHSASELLVYECDGYMIEKNRPDVVVFPTQHRASRRGGQAVQ